MHLIRVPFYEGKQVAVFGLGRSGLSAAHALARSGAQVLAWDDAGEARRQAAEAGLTLRNLAGQPWRDIEALVLSPGVPLTHPAPHPVVRRAREAGAEIICDVELFLRALGPRGAARPPLIAVTGTNGKSTTTALIAHILSCAGHRAVACGNIGVPVLDLPDPAPGQIFVLELSSYQLDLIRTLDAEVAALINISPDHLDRHGGEAGYIAAKRRIFADLGRGARAVIGVDDLPTERICTEISANGLAARGVRVEPVSVGKALGHGVYVLNGVLYEAGMLHTNRIADLGTVPSLRGRHNWQNAAIACACAAPFVPDRNMLAEGLVTFAGLAHRMELVAERDGVRFINDSKATNSDAAARALACFERIYWIAGGRAKEGGIAGLAPFFPRIVKAWLIGEAAPAFAAELKGKVEAEISGDMAAAVAAAARAAAADAQGGAAVLLSPACASFDQYRDFVARGEHFRECVAALDTVRGAA